MRKSIAILITLFVIFIGHLTWAEEPEPTTLEESLLEAVKAKKAQEAQEAKVKAKRIEEVIKRMKASEARRQPRLSTFKKTLKSVGRFQAIKMDISFAAISTDIPRDILDLETNIFILDTKEGHFWIWGSSGNAGFVLMYGGQICPGESMGEGIAYIPIITLPMPKP